MKSRTQKQTELKKAETLLGKSKSLLFLDFSGIGTSQIRELRKRVGELGGSFMVVKKRLLNVLFKEKKIDYDARQFDGSVGTVFAEGSYEDASGPVYTFFSALPETETKKKKDNVAKILGAYDMQGAQAINAETIVQIGQLPPRDVLLSHVLGAIAAPIRAFMYILQEKAKRGDANIADVKDEKAKEEVATADAVAEPATQAEQEKAVDVKIEESKDKEGEKVLPKEEVQEKTNIENEEEKQTVDN